MKTHTKGVAVSYCNKKRKQDMVVSNYHNNCLKEQSIFNPQIKQYTYSPFYCAHKFLICSKQIKPQQSSWARENSSRFYGIAPEKLNLTAIDIYKLVE